MAEVTRDELREYLRWIVALQDSMELVLRTGPQSHFKHSSYKQFARKFNQLAGAISEKMALPKILDFYDIDRMPDAFSTIGIQQKNVFEDVYTNVVLLRSYLENKLGIVQDETVAMRDFFQARLRSAVFGTPGSEREVQDTVEQLLIGRGLQKGLDYDREVGRVKISSKEVVPDFIVNRLSLAIEIKLLKSAARIRELIDEINADVASYSRRYRTIMFIVYDLGYIRDELEFRHDLEDAGNVSVIVVKQ